MNKPAYLDPPVLDIIKIGMYELWYDYTKSECGEKAKLCYMDGDFYLQKKGRKNY